MVRFALVAALVALPVAAVAFAVDLEGTRGRVLGASTEALGELQSGGAAIAAFDFAQAQTYFASAAVSLNAAQAELDTVPQPILSVVRAVPGLGGKLKSGEHLLAAARDFADAGALVADTLAPLASQTVSLTAEEQEATTLLDFVGTLSATADALKAKLTDALDHLQKVQPSTVPEGQRSTFLALRDRLPGLVTQLDRLDELTSILTGFAGGDAAKDYLLVFQNNREMRATGGFLGSLALIEAHRGSVRILEVPGRGPYEINDDSRTMVIPPPPLQLVNDRWQLQDANWWPDWPTSAAKIASFYEEARGFPIHGVVSMTPTLVEDILRETGPVDFTERYGVTLTAENFVTETQREVELDYDRQSNRPKQLIADLLPILLDRLLSVDPEKLLQTLTVLNRGLEEKHLLFFFADPALEERVQRMGWGGELRAAPGDFVSVVHTNISGGKTDGAIDELLEYRVDADAAGTLTATVRITRTHRGNPDNPQEQIRNLDYVRVYAPQGSRFLDAVGTTTIDQSLLLAPHKDALPDKDLDAVESKAIIDEESGTRIWDEFGKTVFANWIQTNLGATQVTTFRYQLPIRLTGEDASYSLLVEKQPGHPGQRFRAIFAMPTEWQLQAQVPHDAWQRTDGVLTAETNLTTDRVFGLALRKR